MAGFSPPLQDRDVSMHSLNGPVHEIAEEKRSKRNPRQLDFEAAMSDFRTMFPGLDVELIESVLRANGGAVDNTIDQLLTLTSDCNDSSTVSTSPPLRPPKRASSMRASTERPVADTPRLPPREGSLKRSKTVPKSGHQPVLYNTPRTQYETEWNGMVIPMLGKLPSDFLRITSKDAPPPRPPKGLSSKHRSQSLRNKIPAHLAEHSPKSRVGSLHHSRGPLPSSVLSLGAKGRHTSATGERLSSNALKRQIEANQRRLQESCDSADADGGDSERFLEDERLALIMQNEEFLRELKRNEDFMRTLEFERDMLATRLAHEQKKNRELSRMPSAGDRSTHMWMAPRASEHDENSLPPSLSSTNESFATANKPASSPTDEQLNPSIVPTERTDKNDVHDFRDQLKSMGASSKKKFALLAKKFFSTSRRRRKAAPKIIRDAHGPSTLNLLDDNDDDDLVDAASSLNISNEDVIFEPLPDAWTSDTPRENTHEERENNSTEHFL